MQQNTRQSGVHQSKGETVRYDSKQQISKKSLSTLLTRAVEFICQKVRGQCSQDAKGTITYYCLRCKE